MGKRTKPPTGQDIGAADFKATCLKLFDRVRDEGAEYVVTKHGKPVARVVPAGVSPTSLHGAFAGRIRITGDLVSTDWQNDWEAARESPNHY
jgi:prevent-host-death family protein